MSLPSSEQHGSRLDIFRRGEECFVWGQNKNSGQPWFLNDNEAALHRDFVKRQVVCPVLGCGAPLTTVHIDSKRDHLRHLSGVSGHSRESMLHSQGCAHIEFWLRTRYPRSTVRREEYTNSSGERRADVLLTARNGVRVAFEVQCSTITPDQWRQRHDSYRAQGIVDVWLFGTTRQQLRTDASGRLLPNPTQHAVVESGSALLFIDPDPLQCKVIVAWKHGYPFPVKMKGESDKIVPVFDDLERASLQSQSLDEFRADVQRGLTSDFLENLYVNTEALRESYDRHQRIYARREREKQAVAAAQLDALKSRRAPQHEKVRELMSEVQQWGKSGASVAARDYFGGNLEGRVDVHFSRGHQELGLLEHWQTAIYFDLIAGNTVAFGAHDALKVIRARNAKLPAKDEFRTIRKWLYRLRDAGFLREVHGDDRFSRFEPTTRGAWH